jgi:hypothetical protein
MAGSIFLLVVSVWGKTELGYRGDAMVQFDWTTGEIMKALEKHGLTENTIYCSTWQF